MDIFKYSNIGNRENNQDYLVSMSLGQDSSLHLVADGMGGYAFGDIASKVVGDSYVYGLSRNMTIEEATLEAIKNIQKERKNLAVSKMGSTVAGVLLDKVDICNKDLQEGDEVLICTDGLYNDCPVDYLIESIRENRFDIDKQNEGFADNHSLIYIKL